MKLAEALLERKTLKVKIEALRERLEENVLIQEGDRPAEDPQALLQELTETLERLEVIIRQIQATNIIARLERGSSVADAIVHRDSLRTQRETLERVATAASSRQFRYGRNEVKFVPTVNVAELRQQIDGLSKRWRELDAEIQAANWTTELIG